MRTQIILRSVIALLLSLCSFSALSVDLSPRQLMVAFRLDALDVPVEPEDVIARIHGPATPERTALLNRLGNPISARSLISRRLPMAARRALHRDHPQRLLQSYFVLTYATNLAASSARALLSRDNSVRGAYIPQPHYFSVTPNDPLFPYDGGTHIPLDRQWGPRVMLNLESAWDFVTGTAYVGVIDNGIQEAHPDLQQNYRAHFSQNFNNPLYSIDERACGEFTAGHGTHVAGIIGATSDNGIGVSGACWNCSLMVGKISCPGISESAVIDALDALVARGTQVINMSFGRQTQPNCLFEPWLPYCAAISFAFGREVHLIAASGNNKTAIQFPASHWLVTAVGGVQVDGNLWDQQMTLPYSPRRNPDAPLIEIGTNFGANQAVVAPARDILSTFYQGFDWAQEIRCGSAQTFVHDYIDGGTAPGFSQTLAYDRQYGVCTGTSMATPFIVGIAALLRTANPLPGPATVLDKIKQYASRAASPDEYWGHGIPNAAASVQDMLATNNRLTPLFSFANATYSDYFYTVVPQMASAAIGLGLLPQPPAGPAAYTPIGPDATAYMSYFPGVSGTPRASLRVFTTPKDSSGVTLYPLYRLSYVDTSPGSSIVRHFYAAGDTDRATVSPLWKLDGIEGYLYRYDQAQPPGTVAVLRRVNPATSSYVIFPENELAFWEAEGFTGIHHISVVGYAYLL